MPEAIATDAKQTVTNVANAYFAKQIQHLLILLALIDFVAVCYHQ